MLEAGQSLSSPEQIPRQSEEAWKQTVHGAPLHLTTLTVNNLQCWNQYKSREKGPKM